MEQKGKEHKKEPYGEGPLERKNMLNDPVFIVSQIETGLKEEVEWQEF